MHRMWTKIGAGALGIFALGMLLLTLLRDARESARSALLSFIGAEDASAVPAPGATPAVEAVPGAPAGTIVAHSGPLASLGARLASLHAGHGRAVHDMPFRLDGDRLGSIQHLTIRRASRGDLPEVSLLVILTDRSAAARLRDCDLVPSDENNVAGDDGFSCAEGPSGDFITVGTARIEPLGINRPIRVSEDAAVDMRDGDPFEANADLGGDVRVSARGEHGQGVQVLADGDGASIKVDDALGRAIVRLLADSTGAFLRVRGKDGRDVVRMQAGHGGFSLTVDTSAAH